MAKSIPVQLGGRTYYLRYGSQSAQRATNELQARMATVWIQQKLQLDQAARLIEEQYDKDAIVIFLSHGFEVKISETKIWGWLDEHLETHETLADIAKAIVDALIEAKLVREVPRVRAEDSTEERPTVPATVTSFNRPVE